MYTKLVNKNYDYFTKKLPELMKEHLDKIAVVKDQKIIKIFDTVSEADQFVLDEKYQHGEFLIQEIDDTIHYVSRFTSFNFSKQ